MLTSDPGGIFRNKLVLMADWMCERAVEDGLTVASMKGHTHGFY